MAESWRAIAMQFAERMRYQNYCNDHASWPDGIEVGCPFCQDRKAYAAFVAKVGCDPFADSYSGPMVKVHDLAPRLGG